MSKSDENILSLIFSEIGKSKNILLTFHNGVDLDSIGSNLAFKKILENMGKKVTLISGDDNISGHITHLPYFDEVVNKKLSEINWSDFDLFILLDIPVLQKLSLLPTPDGNWPIKTIQIDHHVKDNKIKTDIDLLLSASSTSEIIHKIVEEWNLEIDDKIATNLFAGICSDTGGFKFLGTTPNTLLVASKLIEKNADFRFVFRMIEGKENMELKIVGLALSKIIELFNKRVIITTLSQKDIESVGGIWENTRSIHKPILYEMSMSTESSISVIIYDKPAGITGISYRANNPDDPRDVSTIANLLGGGGHKTAASSDFKGSHKEAFEKVVESIQKIYPDLGQP